jgi:hypothetical protein
MRSEGRRSLGFAARGVALALVPVLALAAAFPAAAWGAETDNQSLLERFHAGFASDRLSPPARTAGQDEPVSDRCGTPLVIEYLSHRGELSAATTLIIDQYLSYAEGSDTLVSAGGHFRLSYLDEGDNAVPLEDLDPADGVPDFVARMAGYLETAWEVQVRAVGLRAPPTDRPVEVSFRRMHFYGYTVPVDPAAGTTRLVLHNSFSRFPPNDDPDGDAAGAARVTAAHEFRHAGQYAGSRWSETDWTEMDATWAEERVCDQVNDYHHYLWGDSPVWRPQVPLDGGQSGTGSYDDAVFEIWLNRRWGDGCIRDYWERRVRAPLEKPMASWKAVLAARGTSLELAWADFIGWNYATGSRSVPGVGYPEAAEYPESALYAAVFQYPDEVSGEVEHLAAVPVQLKGFANLGDRLLRLVFDGDDGPGPLALAVCVQTTDGGGYLETVGLDRHNEATLVLRTPASELRTVGVIVGNGAVSGPTRFWTLAVDLVAGPPSPPAVNLLGVEPNPCNPATWFTCAMTARAEATLDIVDARGRLVRRLWTGSLGPGTHRFHWDGRSDDGRPAPSGVYVARLGAAGSWQGRKLTLVR